MNCERCGKHGADIAGEVVLCELCLSLIVREWKVRHDEFGVLKHTFKARRGGGFASSGIYNPIPKGSFLCVEIAPVQPDFRGNQP